jgi:RimJ/RimL family protein N-acetyltransferase
MSAPPKTVLTALADEEAAIRAAVRAAKGQTVAGPQHVDGLFALLSDPRVSDPIYDLPRPITREAIAGWVAESMALREAGEGVLAVNLDEAGVVAGYTRFNVWPDRASGELAGARRSDLQNSGSGRYSVGHAIAWMFETLHLRLIAVTAAVNNVRSAGAIEGAGFQPMGEIDSVRPDGTKRRSLYWELSRDAWVKRHRL